MRIPIYVPLKEAALELEWDPEVLLEVIETHSSIVAREHDGIIYVDIEALKRWRGRYT